MKTIEYSTLKTQFTLLIYFCVGSFLLTGSYGLECYSDHGSAETGYVNKTVVECQAPMNICTEVIVAMRTGNQSVTTMSKGCGLGDATTVYSHATFEDLTARLYKFGCSTSLCNEKNSIIIFPTETPGAGNTTGLECYSCISTTESGCYEQKAEKVACQESFDRCYQANGSISIGNYSQPVFISKCATMACQSLYSQSPWYDINLESSCCTDSYCNKRSEATTPSDAPSTSGSLITNSTTAVPIFTRHTTSTGFSHLPGSWSWCCLFFGLIVAYRI